MAADEDEAKDSATSGTEPGGKPGQDRRARERRQRAPVTIDLAAADVGKVGAVETPTPAASAAEPPPAAKPSPAATPEPPRPPPEKPAPTSPGPAATFVSSAEALRGAAFRAFANDDGWQRHMLSGVAGGVVALIIVIVLQAIGLLPAPGRSAANRALEQAQTASETAVALDHRLSTVEAMTEGLPAMRTEIEGISDRVAALEKVGGSLAAKSDVQTVASGLAALRQQVGEAPAAATAKDLTALNDRITRLEVAVAAGGSTSGDGSAAMASLTSQLAQAEASLRSLNDRLAAAEARMTTGGATGSAGPVQAIAVAALRRAAESDKPFAADLDTVSALGVAGDDIAKLRPIAEKGVPAAATLATEFPAVGDTILAATSAPDPDAGIFQRIVHGLGGLVSIRPTGPIAGSDPSAIVSRMTADVAKGDLAGALSERDGLPQAGKDASAEWAAKAADRVALDALVEQIARSLDVPKT
jgi:hypothetical protein